MKALACWGDGFSGAGDRYGPKKLVGGSAMTRLPWQISFWKLAAQSLTQSQCWHMYDFFASSWSPLGLALQTVFISFSENKWLCLHSLHLYPHLTTECKEGLLPDKGDVSRPYLLIQISIYIRNNLQSSWINMQITCWEVSWTHEPLSNACGYI